MLNKATGIGLVGSGTVGSGVLHLYRTSLPRLQATSPVPLEIRTICDLDFSRCPYDLSGFRQTGDWRSVVQDPEIGVVVELIGGENPARSIIEESLKAGKHVVTANKLVLAKHGKSLLDLAAEKGVFLLFEAAVGGAIPIIAPLGSTLLPNQIQRLSGILNGTTNFILTRMFEEGADFQAVLKEARQKGYAEADPTSDIEGYDSLYKLGILCALAFQAEIDLELVSRQGISKIQAADIRFFKKRGQTIKLVASAEKKTDHRLELRVEPVVLNPDHPLYSVNDVFNAVYLHGDCIGDVMFYGRGAGGVPTASSVWADILAVYRQTAYRPAPLSKAELVPAEEVLGSYYLRLSVSDRIHSTGGVCSLLSAHGIGIREAIQTQGERGTELVLLTHSAVEKDMCQALAALRAAPGVREVSAVLRIGL